jgi:hypothetical protein
MTVCRQEDYIWYVGQLLYQCSGGLNHQMDLHVNRLDQVHDRPRFMNHSSTSFHRGLSNFSDPRHVAWLY